MAQQEQPIQVAEVEVDSTERPVDHKVVQVDRVW
jgi:hypothetical protein